jgi:hypothetical protein
VRRVLDWTRTARMGDNERTLVERSILLERAARRRWSRPANKDGWTAVQLPSRSPKAMGGSTHARRIKGGDSYMFPIDYAAKPAVF